MNANRQNVREIPHGNDALDPVKHDSNAAVEASEGIQKILEYDHNFLRFGGCFKKFSFIRELQSACVQKMDDVYAFDVTKTGTKTKVKLMQFFT